MLPGIVVRNSFRLVAQGHRQEEGIVMLKSLLHACFMVRFDEEVICHSTEGDLWILNIQERRRHHCKSLFLRGTKEISLCLFKEIKSTPTTSIGSSGSKDFQVSYRPPMLGFMVHRESPFVLEAYSDSDYAGANKDRKSITSGCQFLGRRLLSWQCKKQTIVATSSTEAEGGFESPTHIEIPESCLPLRKRVRFASPIPSHEVGESSAAGAARQDKHAIARGDTYSSSRGEDLYGFVYRDMPVHRRLAVMIEREAKIAREAWGISMDASDYAVQMFSRIIETEGDYRDMASDNKKQVHVDLRSLRLRKDTDTDGRVSEAAWTRLYIRSGIAWAPGGGLAERQADNKRKYDDTARNNQNQQPNKRQNTGRAYAAGNGHFKKDCPKWKNNNNRGNQAGNTKAQAKVYAMGNAGANPDNNVVTSTFLLNNRYASILFDTGADRSFVSTAFSSRIVITPTALDHDYNVELADGRIVRLNIKIRGCTLKRL
ncbi:putative reverse transcriptase domain-containing protein [Tanacetum coccineum]|uniref:Reverse transcriptase domain-containing protein n=1 Tax=Tanacetum coccineum TaxID=301880 RepID=A0ABQ4XWF0_9ASTR